jgi:arylsulfatase
MLVFNFNILVFSARTYALLTPDKPFFVYFATGATHAPHHAPKEYIDKYKGKFDQGWDKLREEIFERQKAMGVIPKDAKLTPRPKEIPAWDDQTPEQKNCLPGRWKYLQVLQNTLILR